MHDFRTEISSSSNPRLEDRRASCFFLLALLLLQDLSEAETKLAKSISRERAAQVAADEKKLAVLKAIPKSKRKKVITDQIATIEKSISQPTRLKCPQLWFQTIEVGHVGQIYSTMMIRKKDEEHLVQIKEITGDDSLIVESGERLYNAGGQNVGREKPVAVHLIGIDTTKLIDGRNFNPSQCFEVTDTYSYRGKRIFELTVLDIPDLDAALIRIEKSLQKR